MNLWRIMMNLDIRKAVKANVKGNSNTDFQAVIEDAIENGEEKVLPGLGVLLEMIWESATPESKQTMLTSLESSAK